MVNPYSILGIPKTADEKAVKSAFRKLAKKYHPDQNKDDKNAQAKFAQVNQAYEILGNKEKRKQYDQGEIDEKGNSKFTGFNSAGGSPFDGFRYQTRKGGTSRHSFDASSFGDSEDILNNLFGAGFGGRTRGFSGNHQTQAQQQQRTGAAPSLDMEFSANIGIDELIRGKASIRMPDGRQLSISIPPESANGVVIRLKGKGKTGTGHKIGDALVKLQIRADTNFRLEGSDLHVDSPLSLETAVIGGKTTIDTPNGKLSLKIPAATNSGTLFRLKGKGLPRKRGGYGDLLVCVQIQLPAADQLEQLRKLFWKQ